MCWNSTLKWAFTRSLCTSNYNISSCYIRHYDECHTHESLHFVYRMYSFYLRVLKKTEILFPCTTLTMFVLVMRMLCFVLALSQKLREATVSFVISVCSSLRLSICPSFRLFVRIEQHVSHCTDFHEN
jgi:hypothetical protein